MPLDHNQCVSPDQVPRSSRQLCYQPQPIKGTPGSLSPSQLPLTLLCHLPHASSSANTLCSFSPSSVAMSGCGKPNCGCGSGCQCSSGCGCCKTLAEPTFGGLRNYNAENDCKCGPNCNCADCACHK